MLPVEFKFQESGFVWFLTDAVSLVPRVLAVQFLFAYLLFSSRAQLSPQIMKMWIIDDGLH